jgi:hypothetical protein
MLRLKVERDPVSWAAFSVNVAVTTAPAAKTVPSLFHDRVKTESAEAGFHVVAAMLNVSATLPVFLM